MMTQCQPVSDDPSDLRLLHPAGQRNCGPILEVLEQVLPERGLVLELASGTGQHAAWFAERLPALTWQPSDPEEEAHPSIAAWARHVGHGRILDPILLDVRDPSWTSGPVDAVLCINMLQIAPWTAALALLAGAARHLVEGGPLVIYSPLSRGGVHTSLGNEAFDLRLRTRDPELGLRDTDALCEAAGAVGLEHEQTFAMPAHNTMLALRKRAR